MKQENAQETILALERAALERWCKTDPFGYLKFYADDVVYFDHLTETRLDGIAAVKDHFRQYEGKVNVPRFEMPNPKVQLYGNIAVPDVQLLHLFKRRPDDISLERYQGLPL